MEKKLIKAIKEYIGEFESFENTKRGAIIRLERAETMSGLTKAIATLQQDNNESLAKWDEIFFD